MSIQPLVQQSLRNRLTGSYLSLSTALAIFFLWKPNLEGELALNNLILVASGSSFIFSLLLIFEIDDIIFSKNKSIHLLSEYQKAYSLVFFDLSFFLIIISLFKDEEGLGQYEIPYKEDSYIPIDITLAIILGMIIILVTYKFIILIGKYKPKLEIVMNLYKLETITKRMTDGYTIEKYSKLILSFFEALSNRDWIKIGILSLELSTKEDVLNELDLHEIKILKSKLKEVKP
jgi:hypothetical protein